MFLLVNSQKTEKKTPTLVNLLTRYAPVQDAVLAQLDIVDVISLSKTTKPFMGFVKLVEGTQFNINDRLKHFFTSPNEFRALQAQQNILIGGTFAYEFMARKPLVKTSGRYYLKHLLVHMGSSASALRDFLLRDGYKLILHPGPAGRQKPKHLKLGRVDSNGNYSEVHVRATKHTPVYEAMQAPATSLCNPVTWNRAYSVFSHETFKHKRGFLLRDPKNVTSSEWVDIDLVGLDVLPLKLEDALKEKTKDFLTSQRRIGDASSWVVALDTSRLRTTPSFSDHLVAAANFRLSTQHDVEGGILWNYVNHYVVDVSVLDDLSLRYQYVLPQQMADDLKSFFRDLTIISLNRLPTSQRPQQLAQIYPHPNHHSLDMAPMEGFTPPEGSNWKYHDDQMVWYLKKHYPELDMELPSVDR